MESAIWVRTIKSARATAACLSTRVENAELRKCEISQYSQLHSDQYDESRWHLRATCSRFPTCDRIRAQQLAAATIGPNHPTSPSSRVSVSLSPARETRQRNLRARLQTICTQVVATEILSLSIELPLPLLRI